jgi:hypothetical protein
MGFMLGRVIARYLERPAAGYEPFAPSDPDALRAALEPRDVLLVEGNTHIAGVINISRNRPGRMRRSTSVRSATPCQKTASRWCWSKPIRRRRRRRTFIEICALSHAHLPARRLTEDDRARVCVYAAERIGFDYDLNNILDLLRYLFPRPVPQRWRRRMMALGSGHPTRIIWSALIAQAFQRVGYPILPKVRHDGSVLARAEMMEIRHSSLYAPRDFDIWAVFRSGEAHDPARLRLQGARLAASRRCRCAGGCARK